ncbi:uncharacterized protein LOC125371591 isoform X2 [Haliotis rufescens]|uniref:uncharacterized protein LOC125371591 isoform X2 n=1 Tax=Haliotis rufescens TaxID=6454 RepID=UPI001EB042C9|nr:uncharacterized protein LOC125371591 isoform X2 [Haliotis rufescens]
MQATESNETRRSLMDLHGDRCYFRYSQTTPFWLLLLHFVSTSVFAFCSLSRTYRTFFTMYATVALVYHQAQDDLHRFRTYQAPVSQTTLPVPDPFRYINRGRDTDKYRIVTDNAERLMFSVQLTAAIVSRDLETLYRFFSSVIN